MPDTKPIYRLDPVARWEAAVRHRGQLRRVTYSSGRDDVVREVVGLVVGPATILAGGGSDPVVVNDERRGLVAISLATVVAIEPVTTGEG